MHATRSRTKDQVNDDVQAKQANDATTSNIQWNRKKNLPLVKNINLVKKMNYNIDEIVLAKQKYSRPWPSRIVEIRKSSVLVDFLGDDTHGTVRRDEIYDFMLNAQSIKIYCRRQDNYKKGVLLAERLLGIPDHHSILSI